MMGPWASQDILGDFGSLDPGSNPGGSVVSLIWTKTSKKNIKKYAK